MTSNEAINILKAKLACMELEDLSSVEKGCVKNCEECRYNYEQGTRGQKKDAIKIAINALQKCTEHN